MIYVYGLTYRVVDYARRSINSIIENASEPIHFTVIDSKSENSDRIYNEVCRPLIHQGKIQNYVQLKKNANIIGLYQGYDLFPPDKTEQFFVFTELDLVVPGDWIKEIREADYQFCGFKLDETNYVYPNGGHTDNGHDCGYWLMSINRKIFDKVRPKKKGMMDRQLRQKFYDQGFKMKQIQMPLYHLAWDLWKDDPQYFKKKVDGFEWNIGLPSPIEFVDKNGRVYDNYDRNS